MSVRLLRRLLALIPTLFFTLPIGSLANRFISGDVIDMMRSQNHVAANKF